MTHIGFVWKYAIPLKSLNPLESHHFPIFFPFFMAISIRYTPFWSILWLGLNHQPQPIGWRPRRRFRTRISGFSGSCGLKNMRWWSQMTHFISFVLKKIIENEWKWSKMGKFREWLSNFHMIQLVWPSMLRRMETPWKVARWMSTFGFPTSQQYDV